MDIVNVGYCRVLMSPSFITIRSGAVLRKKRETLLETADVVSLHVPLNDAMRDMIDAKALIRAAQGDSDQYVSR